MRPRRIAIVGGGISGLTLARELTRLGAREQFTLFEQSGRLGGTVETVRRDGFIIECGPDGWVTEKPWARDLACELGLADELLPSRDATRKTYIVQHGRLVAMPDGMRLMVPTDLDTACRSPLFSPRALAAFQGEITRAAALKNAAPAHDESVASFVERHFGPEVLHTVAAPLLSGVFGGDVRRLSARAVLPQLVAVERRDGSLILGLQRQHERTPEAARSSLTAAILPEGETQSSRGQAIFTTVRSGLGTLVDALARSVPETCLRRNTAVRSLRWDGNHWALGLHTHAAHPGSRSREALRETLEESVDAVVLATPLDASRSLLTTVDSRAARLLPAEASSSITIAFAWPDVGFSRRDIRTAGRPSFAPPPGFGLLVPPRRGPRGAFGPQILAATFADQKFDGRAPEGGRLIRVFYGGAAAERLWRFADDRLSARALRELRHLLGPLPAAPPLIVFRRWRHSLPQYEVGHLDRAGELDHRLHSHAGLHLLGNTLRGVGLPDLVREAKALAPVLLT